LGFAYIQYLRAGHDADLVRVLKGPFEGSLGTHELRANVILDEAFVSQCFLPQVLKLPGTTRRGVFIFPEKFRTIPPMLVAPVPSDPSRWWIVDQDNNAVRAALFKEKNPEVDIERLPDTSIPLAGAFARIIERKLDTTDGPRASPTSPETSDKQGASFAGTITKYFFYFGLLGSPIEAAKEIRSLDYYVEVRDGREADSKVLIVSCPGSPSVHVTSILKEIVDRFGGQFDGDEVGPTR
jgi:hypothetical protein